MTRNYDAASPSRRTNNWRKHRGDVNSITAVAGLELRTQARDLIRNNSWAKRGQRTIANNVVGWGVVPKSNSGDPSVDTAAMRLWKTWADTTECDIDGRRTFYGLQQQIMKSVASDGEVLIRRRRMPAADLLAVPLQLQVLEADYLDTAKDEEISRGKIVQGVEFDSRGRRAAYWLFPAHPGSGGDQKSVRIVADDIVHIFDAERPGQARGVSWFASAIVNLRDFDEFEDAELMRQKIAACFAVFVEDADGAGTALGDTDSSDETIESLEPGQIQQLKPGQKVSFATPPGTTSDSFAGRQLRRVAAGLGVTYEDLTGDYSQVNFSSARLARISHQGNVKDWQYNLLIPQFCTPAWRWFAAAAVLDKKLPIEPGVEWTVPPLPMIEPDKEGLAIARLIRTGAMTFSGMVREQGGDPEAHWQEYAADLARLDELKIRLDSDVRAVSQAGLTQERVGPAKKEET